jgi:hypothetical protein
LVLQKSRLSVCGARSEHEMNTVLSLFQETKVKAQADVEGQLTIAITHIIARPAATTAEISTELDDWQRKVAALVARLADGVPDDVGERSAEQQARWLLAFMLDWHGREKKARLVGILPASRPLGGRSTS